MGDGEERRRDLRLSIPATAVLFREGVEIGQYAVDNLSGGGALLTGETEVAAGDRLRVLLQIAGLDSLDLEAEVVRQETQGATAALAVQFDHDAGLSEDSLRDALYGPNAPWSVEDDDRVSPRVEPDDTDDVAALRGRR